MPSRKKITHSKRKVKAWFKGEVLTFRKLLRRKINPYSESSGSISEFAMDTSDGSSSINNEAKKRKLHEAQLIPGLRPGRVFGFPNSIITTMRYAEVLNLTSTLGAIGFNTFNANSIFDPNETGVGHQPMYRDQWAGIYDQYVVLGSKITVYFAPQAATANFVVGICGDDNNAFPTALTDKMEQNNSVYTVVSPFCGKVPVLTMTFEPQECFGVDAKSDGSSQTSVGSNPSELWCFGVWCHTMNSTTAKVDITVEIEYTVKFSELQTPLSS